MMKTAGISLVWWERGGRVSWKRPGQKLRTNRDCQPQTEADVRAAFEAAGVDISGAEIRQGRVALCPRCRGTGRHQGGPCFRCYGNEPASWTPVG